MLDATTKFFKSNSIKKGHFQKNSYLSFKMRRRLNFFFHTFNYVVPYYRTSNGNWKSTFAYFNLWFPVIPTWKVCWIRMRRQLKFFKEWWQGSFVLCIKTAVQVSLVYMHWVFHRTQKVLWNGKICSYYELILKHVFVHFLSFVSKLCLCFPILN